MDGKWLEDFLSVSRTGSFSRSATEQHITQSAFSRRIKALERWAGTPLIDRSTYPTRLTTAGARFREVAEQVLGSLREARQDLRATNEPHECTLRIATQHSLASGFLMRWLTETREPLGNPAIQVRADNLHDCVRDLDEGIVDVLICYEHPALPIGIDPQRFPWTRIASSLLVPVSSPAEGGRPRFSLRRAAREAGVPMLHYGADSFLGRAVGLVISHQSLEPRLRVVFQSTVTEALRAAAVAGMGIAWLPRHYVEEDLSCGTLVHAGSARHEMALDVRLYVNRARLGDRLAALKIYERKE